MRLFQYRFSANDWADAEYVGGRIEVAFNSMRLLDFVAIGSSNSGGERLEKLIGIGEVAEVSTLAFSQSYSRVINYPYFSFLKHLGSCRFVSFEDDGLVRICISSDDVLEGIFEGKVLSEDVSNLMIDTDLYDYV